MKNKDASENTSPFENFKTLLSKAFTRESDPTKVIFSSAVLEKIKKIIIGRILHDFALASTNIRIDFWLNCGILSFHRNFSDNNVQIKIS